MILSKDMNHTFVNAMSFGVLFCSISLPDAVSSSEDPLLRDQSAPAGVSPLAVIVVLQGNLQSEHSWMNILKFSAFPLFFFKFMSCFDIYRFKIDFPEKFGQISWMAFFFSKNPVTVWFLFAVCPWTLHCLWDEPHKLSQHLCSPCAVRAGEHRRWAEWLLETAVAVPARANCWGWHRVLQPPWRSEGGRRASHSRTLRGQTQALGYWQADSNPRPARCKMWRRCWKPMLRLPPTTKRANTRSFIMSVSQVLCSEKSGVFIPYLVLCNNNKKSGYVFFIWQILLSRRSQAWQGERPEWACTAIAQLWRLLEKCPGHCLFAETPAVLTGWNDKLLLKKRKPW